MSSLKDQKNQDFNQRKRGDGGQFNSLAMSSWKSLDELSNSEGFQNFVHQEFPKQASEISGSGVSRRQFLGLMSSSIALAGITNCNLIRRPKEHILPYNNQPENIVPGRPTYYTTAVAIGQEVTGLLVETHEGRPTKIEGNSKHPSNLGSTNSFHQAEILNLYNPNRLQFITAYDKKVSESFFRKELLALIDKHKFRKGAGLVFLAEYFTSPSLYDLKRKIRKKLPKAEWYTYEPVNQDLSENALSKIIGQSSFARYDFKKASRIVSFDCDFLGQEVDSILYSKDFVFRRDVDAHIKMNRLYMLESQYSLTGVRADHRFALNPREVQNSLWIMADCFYNSIGLELPYGVQKVFINTIRQAVGLIPREVKEKTKWLPALCRDLIQYKGESLICVGQDQPESLHALAHLLNESLNSVGKTVFYLPHQTKVYNQSSNKVSSLSTLSRRMAQNKIETLFILGGNPSFLAPGDVNFSSVIKKIKNTFYLGFFENETSRDCNWVIPQSHFLESWGDVQTRDGIVSIVQPCIMPLYNSMSPLLLLDTILGGKHDELGIVKDYWQKKYNNSLRFDSLWKLALKRGVLKNNKKTSIRFITNASALKKFCLLYIEDLRDIQNKKSMVQLAFKPHATQYDGRYAENTWLQELPDPLTRLTWDNAAIINVKTAKKYNLMGDFLDGNSGIALGKNNVKMIRLAANKRVIDLPVFILPGISDDTIILNVGYGRSVVSEVSQGTGFDVSPLRSTKHFYNVCDASISTLSKSYPLACVQEHWSMEGRDLARLKDQKEKEDHHAGRHGVAPSLFKEQDYSQGHQWGMTIDLNKCTGCGTCVTSCQAENNIPVVGKKDVILNREMHWIRMDRYFVGDEDNPFVVHQAVACQHCEMAPCETVCPVSATTHSTEGLNEMTYNRCIGTRYCSNNCPYKVRRFNFFNYTNEFEETEKMVHNPDVSLRFRGVMEKCTYCVQRINEKRIEHKNQGEEVIPDSSITTACEQSCPADAIIFGNINDPKSRVAQSKRSKRNYDLLAELNTRPRTSYLGRVLNQNPEIKNYVKQIKSVSAHH